MTAVLAAVSVVLLIALIVPLVAVLRDAPVFRRSVPPAPTPTAPTAPDPATLEEVLRRLGALEDEVDDLNHAVRELADETEHLRNLISRSRDSDI